MQASPTKHFPAIREEEYQYTIPLALIVIAGAVLRFANLGQDSLWLDEAGVAYAARAASLGDMLQVVRSHVLAMPLDYLVVWLVGRINVSEGALRIPAALWGTLSIPLAYLVFRKLVSARAALLGALVLAISPLHVQYSQELRFYASLVFFYLLSTLLLWNALERLSPTRWVLATAAAVVGIYFHPYVILAMANGLVWLALGEWKGDAARKKRIAFLLSATVTLLAFLVGFRVFSASNTFRIPLMVFEESPWSALAAGLGWLPFYPGTPGWNWLFGFICALLEIMGAFAILRGGWRSPLSGFLFAVLAQFAAILAMDLLGHYFFAPRQLLTLLPGLCLLAGVGASALVDWFSRQIRARLKASWSNHVITGLAAALLVISCLPALAYYQRDDKGNSRLLVQQIVQDWQPGSAVLIIPGHEGYVYKYYAEYVFNRADIGEKTYAAEWKDLDGVQEMTGQVFIVTDQRISESERGRLAGMGFHPVYESYPLSRYAKVLWKSD